MAHIAEAHMQADLIGLLFKEILKMAAMKVYKCAWDSGL